jgi:hypothetical protein
MKRLSLIVIAALICVAIVFALDEGDSSKRTLTDGTVLTLSGAKIGRTNVYTHGTFLTRTLGSLLPTNGLTLRGFKFKRPVKTTFVGPEGSEILSVQLRLSFGSPRERALEAPPFFRKYRLLIRGDDDFSYVKEIDGFKLQPDGLFADIWAWSFPRSSKQLHFRLEERNKRDSTDWHEVTTFVLRNPKPAKIETWQTQDSPRLKIAEDLELQIGELTVSHEPHPFDIWEEKALLPVRVVSHGNVVTNWGIHNGPIRDATGNLDFFTFSKIITNDWMVYQDFRPLDPAVPWRFRVSLARDSDFPETNLYHFTIRWPVKGTIQTNFAGFPALISFVNQYMLSVELPTKPANNRLTFVSAVDDKGSDMDDRTGSWSQHSFWRSLKSFRLSSPTPIRVTIAILTNYPVEFTLDPRREAPSSAISDGGGKSPPGK